MLFAAVAGLLACTPQPKDEITASGLKRSDFQAEVDGKKTDLYRLANASGMEVCVTNYGGRVVSVLAPGKGGAMYDVVLGFDSIAKRIEQFPQVSSIYLMSGGFDFTVIIEGRSMRLVAEFVRNNLSTIEGVLSTATHFVLRRYKDHGVIFDELHTQPNRKLFDVMLQGSGDARMQPLYFLITTAGNDTIKL